MGGRAIDEDVCFRVERWNLRRFSQKKKPSVGTTTKHTQISMTTTTNALTALATVYEEDEANEAPGGGPGDLADLGLEALFDLAEEDSAFALVRTVSQSSS